MTDTSRPEAASCSNAAFPHTWPAPDPPSYFGIATTSAWSMDAMASPLTTTLISKSNQAHPCKWLRGIMKILLCIQSWHWKRPEASLRADTHATQTTWGRPQSMFTSYWVSRLINDCSLTGKSQHWIYCWDFTQWDQSLYFSDENTAAMQREVASGVKLLSSFFLCLLSIFGLLAFYSSSTTTWFP